MSIRLKIAVKSRAPILTLSLALAWPWLLLGSSASGFGSDAGAVVGYDSAPPPHQTSGPTSAPIALVNGSFESVQIPYGGYVQLEELPGWETRVTEIWSSGFLNQPASDGVRFAELDARGGIDGISQVVPTEAGQNYRLTFDVKQRDGTAAASNTIEIRLNDDTALTFTPRGTSWESVSLIFVGTGSDAIGFFETSEANTGSGTHLDNVRIETAILPTQTSAAVSLCRSGGVNRLVNGSFEHTSNPDFGSTKELVTSLGFRNNSGFFFDRHTDTDFPGWFATGGIALQQGGVSQGGTIEPGTDGFLGVNAVEGGVFVEMDGNRHNQRVAVTPGERLVWELSHRGRPGTDSVSVAIGPESNQSDLAVLFSPDGFWVTHSGSYTVPTEVTEVLFTLTPLTAANGDIDSSNLLDDVKLCSAS